MDKRQRKRAWEQIRKDRHEGWAEEQAQKRRNNRLASLRSNSGEATRLNCGFDAMRQSGQLD